MNSRKLVTDTITGKNTTNITPMYGWVSLNMTEKIEKNYGSVRNFEDHYHFDMAHIFGGPNPFNYDEFMKIRAQGIELTPDIMLDIPFWSPDNMSDYQGIINDLEFYQKQRERFCYMQTNGLFECLNGPFGIENQLCYMALYPDEMTELYKRMAQWNKKFADHVMELNVDMVHISDDWGGQSSLMFSKTMLGEMIVPAQKIVNDYVKSKGFLMGMHSDGHVLPALDVITDLGYDMFHPWQESAGMPYSAWLDGYSDKFAILGGLCIQTTLGFGNTNRVKSELDRVFGILKGKRWCFCTSHFVQDHCSIDEMAYAFDYAEKLAKNK